MLQPCAIVVEMIFGVLLRRIAGEDVAERFPRMTRWLGYIWVGCVMCWTVPEFAMGFLIPLTGSDINTNFA
jgi:hypothetical protein